MFWYFWRYPHSPNALKRFSWAFRAGASSPLACFPLTRPFFLAPTTSKGLLRRLIELQQIRSEHRIQLTVQPYKLRSKSRKAILFHVDNCRRYFLVCQLKIVFYFLHELKEGVLTSLDGTRRNCRRLKFKFCFTHDCMQPFGTV